MGGVSDTEDQGPPRLNWDDLESSDTSAAEGAQSVRQRQRGGLLQHSRRWLTSALVVAAVAVSGAAAVVVWRTATGDATVPARQQMSPTLSTTGSEPVTGTAESVASAGGRSNASPPTRRNSGDSGTTGVEVPAALREENESWDPLSALDQLPRANGRSSAEFPYDRSYYGQQWLDVDRNGCDTRNDVLRRDLQDLVVKEGTHGCVAYRGTLVDPYTGTAFEFERGSGNAGELHVDHIVALADAWHGGAHSWSETQRERFANDPMNLVVTLGDVNQAKGAKGADQWLPPDPQMRCGFAVQVVWVKDQYDLAVSEQEAEALGRTLATCEGSFPGLVGTE